MALGGGHQIQPVDLRKGHPVAAFHNLVDVIRRHGEGLKTASVSDGQMVDDAFHPSLVGNE